MSRTLGLALGTLFLAVGAGGLGCAEEPPPRVAEQRVAPLLEALLAEEAAVQEDALREIEAARDTRFVAPLIELVRAGQLGIAGRRGYNQRVIALERLTGQSLGGDWFGWAEWYAGTDLEPPPGFIGWKGRLLGALDARYAELLGPGTPARIRVEEIDWGGVPIDGIPSLDEPPHLPAAQADYLQEGEPVFGVRVGDESRAYPLRILDWHEIVNDTLGGTPISLAYCTLCGSGIVYDGRVPGLPEPLRFSTSGLLHRSNKLMLDRRTHSLWSQLTGRPVVGELAGPGHEELELRMLPAVVTTWSAWRLQHPETTVLSLATGYRRPYRPGEPYGGYFASSEKLFPVHEARRELPAKQRVFGLARGAEARAWSLEALTREKVRGDELAGQPIVLVAHHGRIEVEGYAERVGPVRYDAGAEVRAYAVPTSGFRLGPDEQTLLDGAGHRWRITEEALIGPGGARAERIPGILAYWFAWQAFHPDTLLVP